MSSQLLNINYQICLSISTVSIPPFPSYQYSSPINFPCSPQTFPKQTEESEQQSQITTSPLHFWQLIAHKKYSRRLYNHSFSVSTSIAILYIFFNLYSVILLNNIMACYQVCWALFWWSIGWGCFRYTCVSNLLEYILGIMELETVITLKQHIIQQDQHNPLITIIIPRKKPKKMLTQQQIKQSTNNEQPDRTYKVDLSNKLISRIANLRSFPKIRYLQLNFNRIRTIENLECLPDLRELHLEYNQLTEIGGLDGNKMVTVLALGNNRIQRIENIGHLGRLQTLILDNNRIDKLSGLQLLKQLKTLSLNNNNLTSIDSLPAFSKLQSLQAQHNQIRKISPTIFSKSTKLQKLNLSHNQIEDVTFVNCIASLEWLDLQANRVRLLDFVQLRNLEYLNVSDNMVESLPKISVVFPELTVFLFANNQIVSEYQVLQSLSQSQMLVQVDFRGNIMQTPQFSDTLHKIYGFDRINQKNYNKPGTRYIQQAHQLNKIIKQEGFSEIQNDEEFRKILLSGFFNDALEEEMTGVKPDRPSSPGKRGGAKLNFEDMERSYNDIMNNQKRLEALRRQCLTIFKANNIIIQNPATARQSQQPQQQSDVSNSRAQHLTEPRTSLTEKTGSINTLTQLSSKNQQYMNKWKELKNKEKNFNIRGVVRKMSGSQRKPPSGSGIKEGSLSKIQNSQERTSELMRTQLAPPRWNNDPSLMRTMQSRPLSAKKKIPEK